jgi:hypothetical protein
MAIGASDKGCKILGIILFWASVVVVAFTVKTGLETSAQAKWPTVEGNLIKAEFREVIEKKNSGQANDEENELIKNRYWIPMNTESINISMLVTEFQLLIQHAMMRATLWIFVV